MLGDTMYTKLKIRQNESMLLVRIVATLAGRVEWAGGGVTDYKGPREGLLGGWKCSI